MAKVFYSRKVISNNPATAIPLVQINAQIVSFWGTTGAEKLFPIPYWKFDKYFKDYNKVAIYVNSDNKDDVDVELRPFISANIEEYESDSVPGFFFVIYENYYNGIFLEDDKPKSLCMVRIGKTDDDEIFIYLHKSLPLSLNNGNAGPDGGGSGSEIPPY